MKRNKDIMKSVCVSKINNKVHKFPIMNVIFENGVK